MVNTTVTGNGDGSGDLKHLAIFFTEKSKTAWIMITHKDKIQSKLARQMARKNVIFSGEKRPRRTTKQKRKQCRGEVYCSRR